MAGQGRAPRSSRCCPAATTGDSIGALVRARFGDEVHERLVDALVGSIYATDTDHSAWRWCPSSPRSPAAAAACCSAPARCAPPPRRRRSDLLRARARGMGSLVDAVAAAAAVGGVAISHRPPGHERRRGRPGVARRRRARSTPSCSPRRPRRRRRCSPRARRSWRGCWRRWSTPSVVLVTPRRAALARAPPRPQRLPRPEAGAATRDGGVVRLAEVGALARRRRARSCASRSGATGCPSTTSTTTRVVRHAVDELGRHIGVDVQPTAVRVSPLAGRVPAVPAAPPRLAGPRRRGAARPGSSSPAPATTASASRRASTRAAGPPPPSPPTSPVTRRLAPWPALPMGS